MQHTIEKAVILSDKDKLTPEDFFFKPVMSGGGEVFEGTIEEMEKKIYKLIPEAWHEDIRHYTEDEFTDSEKRDGKLVKGADDLAAYIEAHLALSNGIKNGALVNAMDSLKEKYKGQNDISGIDFEAIYSNFKNI